MACRNTGQVFKMQSSMTPMTPYTKGTQLSAWVPRFGFGSMYRTQIRVDRCLCAYAVCDGQGILRRWNRALAIATIFMCKSGMSLRPNSRLDLSPSILFPSTPDVPSILDLNLVATMADAYTVGFGFRTNNSFTFLSQCRINDHFRFGYMRDFATSDIRTWPRGATARNCSRLGLRS